MHQNAVNTPVLDWCDVAYIVCKELIIMEIYVVRAGDTLSSIGEMFGVSAAFLSETNRISPDVPLVVGQTIVIPIG